MAVKWSMRNRFEDGLACFSLWRIPIMTRKLGSILIAFATILIVLADSSDAQARRRLFGGGGSWGDNGSHGSWGGNGGSWGSNGGSCGGRWRRHGSNGSWGGRWDCGSHGGNGSYGGNGSHGGTYDNGCGSHGGTYHNGAPSGGSAYYGEGNVYSAERQSEVRYYGRRNGETAAPAPIYREGEVSAERRDMQGDANSRSATRQSETPGSAAGTTGDSNVNPPEPPSPGHQQQGPGGPPPQGLQGSDGSTQPNSNPTGAATGAGT
jgi:hypothetical protein